MTGLDLSLRLADPDQAYAELLALYEGLDPARHQAVSARLILLLANHIGDLAVLRQAVALARDPMSDSQGEHADG